MSIEAVAIALHHSQAKGTAKLVLIGIANHDGDAGSFPKVSTLARYANVHPRRIPEAIAQLVALGEITVDQKAGGLNVRAEIAPNLYHITLDCPANCDGTRRHQLLDAQGYALKFGRSYQGAYDPSREKDPDAVERGKKAWETRQGAPVDNRDQGAPGPSVENSTSAENSTTPSAENSTTPSAENSTTKNHPKNHTKNPALVPSVTSADQAVEKSVACHEGMHDACSFRGCGCVCHGGDLRAIVPALPRAGTARDDATGKGIKDPLGLTEEQKSRNARGAAMARAALRGEQIKEAVDHKGRTSSPEATSAAVSD